MMNNLFSMFDSSSSYMKINWLIMLVPMMIMMKMYKKMNSNIKSMKMLIIKTILSEIKPLMSNKAKKGKTLMFLSIFLSISMSNLLAMFPFNFTISAHMMLSFPIALIMWMSMMMFGWINNPKNMMAHSVPNGTPIILMNFMVLIEMTSNIIRPLTLAIRLSANMVAGHLLLSLLSNFSLMSTNNMILSSPMLMVMLFLELAVSMIQAYVFMTLLTLYSTEIH